MRLKSRRDEGDYLYLDKATDQHQEQQVIQRYRNEYGSNSAWPLARVTEVIPGKDVPITKVCPLPLETSPTPDAEIVLEHKPVHRRTRNSRLAFIAVIALFMSLIMGVPATVHNFPKPTPAYFSMQGDLFFVERHVEFMVSHNLTTLKEDIVTLVKGVTHLRNLCNRPPYDKDCDRVAIDLVQDAETWTNTIQHLTPSTRPKRAAPIIVGAAVLMVGATVGAVGATLSLKSSVEEFKSRVEELDSRQEVLLSTMNQQTLILEQSTNFTEKLHSQASAARRAHDRLFNYTQKKVSQMLYKLEIQELLTAAETLRQEIQMVTTLQGPHTQLLRRANISNFIRSVCNNSGIDTVLTTSLVQFIETELSEDTLTFRFSLPITSQVVYSRYSVTALPIIDGKRMRWVRPSLTNVAVNGDEVRPVEPSRCDVRMTTWICRPGPPKIEDILVKCVAALWRQLPLKPDCDYYDVPIRDFVTPIGERAWAFVLTSPLTIMNETLMGSGIVSEHKLNVTETLIIPDSHSIYAPPMNDDLMTPETTPRDNHDDIIQLMDKVQQLKNDEPRTWIITREHTTIGLSGAAILGICCIVCGYVCKRSKKNQIMTDYRDHFGLA